MFLGEDGSYRDREGCDSGSSVTSSEQDRNVAALSQTCVMLQSQVDTLQRNLASVIQFVSERSRHSSSSQDTPPLTRSSHPHMMTASLDLKPDMVPVPTLPSSMTMSLPPSLLLPAPVTLSKSCDSLAQVTQDPLSSVMCLCLSNYYFFIKLHAKLMFLSLSVHKLLVEPT